MNLVFAWLELVSFQVAVFVCTAIVVLFGLASGHQPLSISVWLWSTVAIVAAFSAWIGAYSIKRWERAAPHGAGIVLLIGHLASIAAVAMLWFGNAYGVLLLLPSLWGGVFYLIGISMTALRLAESTPD